MIERMKYVNIAGHRKELDRVIEQYITVFDIQLDYATHELEDTEGITSFTEINPFSAFLTETAFIRKRLVGVTPDTAKISKDTAAALITDASELFSALKKQTNELNNEISVLDDLIENVSHFTSLNFNIKDLSEFTHIDYRFGRMPLSGFKQFETLLYKDSKVICESADSDNEYVWCVYFAPHNAIKKEDIIFSSLHFNMFEFPKEFDGVPLDGTPKDALEFLTKKRDALLKKREQLEEEAVASLNVSPQQLAGACDYIEKAAKNFDYRKYAGLTSYDYFVFVGWMPAKQVKKLAAAIELDDKLALVIENTNDSIRSAPPTKLKNGFLFKPFEFLVRMYGVPRYDEIDPTPFVAVTYCVFFGMMFGDVGQGLLLSAIGFYLNRFRKVQLGAILGIVGIFSAVFGLMYGSIFGFEDIIPALWLRPSHDIMTLVIFAVSAGGVTILTCMLLNILNSIKNRDLGRLLFDQNGVSGLVFYLSIIAYGLLAFLAGTRLHMAFIIVFTALPLILIAFKEPLGALIDKKKKHEPVKSVGMFVFTALMELIEVILSFFTNTLSFVRLAGYAISHAGLMSVVMILSGYETGNANIAVIIIGNLFVMGLEGLIVFIQAMRLQYYEMFSRYYKGGGKEFTANKNL